MASRFGFVLLALALSVAAGCKDRTEGRASEGAGGREVSLLAAKSTTDAVTELAATFESQTGWKVSVTTGSSNALASQIMAGVPGHAFLSANTRWAQAVLDAGLGLESRPLLSNRMVIVVPRGNPAGVNSPADLRGQKVSRVALAGENVPAGIYAGQALRWAGVYDELVARERVARGQDVRLTLAYVEAGEAQAGIVYATDARVSDKVEVAYTFPAEAHDPIVYPLVLLKTGGDEAAARRLYEYLLKPRTLAVFSKHGFSPAGAEVEPTP